MSGAATTIMAGAAAVTAGVGVYGAIQAHKQASTATGMAQTTFGEQQQYAQQLQALIANPSSVSQLPGYQFQMKQGAAAVAAGMGAQSGGRLLGTPAEAQQLTEFGQGLASNFYGQQTQLLAGLSGLQTATSPATYQQTALNAYGQTQANATNALQQMGMMYGMYKGGMFGGSAGTPASTGFSAGAQAPAAWGNYDPNAGVLNYGVSGAGSPVLNYGVAPG